MKNVLFVSVLSVLLINVSGCSNPFATHYDNLRLAILLDRDANLTLEQVNDSRVDLALIKSGNRPKAVIAKAFTEYGKEKWISKDRAMLIFEGYRITRTLGFENDQIAIFSATPDPLKDYELLDGKNWYWEVDWEVGEYGYPVTASYETSLVQIEIQGKRFQTLHIVESAEYGKQSSIFDDVSWQNHYWVDRESGLLLRTHQQGAPFSDRFEITLVSNANRVLAQQGEEL